MNAPQRFAPNPLVEAAIEYGQSLKLEAPWETNAQGQIIMNRPIGFRRADRADENGDMHFFDGSGELTQSTVVPEVPKRF